MTEVELSILAQHHKLVKLAKIWRAIARRHLSRIETHAEATQRASWTWADLSDGETDP